MGVQVSQQFFFVRLEDWDEIDCFGVRQADGELGLLQELNLSDVSAESQVMVHQCIRLLAVRFVHSHTGMSGRLILECDSNW